MRLSKLLQVFSGIFGGDRQTLAHRHFRQVNQDFVENGRAPIRAINSRMYPFVAENGLFLGFSQGTILSKRDNGLLGGLERLGFKEHGITFLTTLGGHYQTFEVRRAPNGQRQPLARTSLGRVA